MKQILCGNLFFCRNFAPEFLHSNTINQMKQRLLLFCLYIACTFIGASAQPRQMQRVDDPTGYKDTYKDYFTIGVALNFRNIASPEQMAIVKKNFNSVTAENAMKPGEIHPKEDVWN